MNRFGGGAGHRATALPLLPLQWLTYWAGLYLELERFSRRALISTISKINISIIIANITKWYGTFMFISIPSTFLRTVSKFSRHTLYIYRVSRFTWWHHVFRKLYFREKCFRQKFWLRGGHKMVPLVWPWMALSRSEQSHSEFFKWNLLFFYYIRLWLKSRAFQNTIIKYFFIKYFSSYNVCWFSTNQ